MKNFKDSTLSMALRLSSFVQLALVITGAILYCLPNHAGQNYVVFLAPFVAGAPLAGLLLTALPVSNLEWATSFPVMIGMGLIANFVAYTAICYAGLSLRKVILQMPRLAS